MSRKKRNKNMSETGRKVSIDLVQMQARCLAEIGDLEPEFVMHTAANGQRYWFRAHPSGEADVLAVAHQDTVVKFTEAKHFEHVDASGTHLVYCAQLDDRIGVYLACDYLPQLGVVADVLLTEDEESCRSSAFHFKTEKTYNWMFQFDRGGDDMVMYQYATPELRKLWADVGFRIGSGSYTDIVDLDHLGIAGFNLGTGYQNYHSKLAYLDMDQTFSSLRKFLAFYRAHGATPFTHTPSRNRAQGRAATGLNEYSWSKLAQGNVWRKCHTCQEWCKQIEMDEESGICWQCIGLELSTAEPCPDCGNTMSKTSRESYGSCYDCWRKNGSPRQGNSDACLECGETGKARVNGVCMDCREDIAAERLMEELEACPRCTEMKSADFIMRIGVCYACFSELTKTREYVAADWTTQCDQCGKWRANHLYDGKTSCHVCQKKGERNYGLVCDECGRSTYYTVNGKCASCTEGEKHLGNA
jgi:hypothetical protein